MFQFLTRALDGVRGIGEAAVTVPPMDGALRPNFRIENAPLVHSIEAPDNLVLHNGEVLFSSGPRLLKLGEPGGSPIELEQLSSDVTCLASHSAGTLVIGLAEGKVLIRNGGRETSISQLEGRPIVCATAATFGDANTLFLCLGSQQFKPADWKRDLMSKNASGSVWRIDVPTLKATCLTDRLAYPYGVALAANGDVIVSEAWRQQLIVLSPQGRHRTLYGDIPGYPSRIVSDPIGTDLWLAVFAPRTQLIEFVLRETEYRTRMMAEIDPEYWIAPSLHAARSFLEPLQGGSQKQLGELKPWAPSRSYGLVVRLDSSCLPIESLHSRANGIRHGVTSCLPHGPNVIVASKGGGAIAAVER